MMSGELQLAIEQRIMAGTTFMGVPALKNPMDAWVYQEIIWEQTPDVIVEVGNRKGGSLLYLSMLCSVFGCGEVIGVDVDRSEITSVELAYPIRLVTGDALAVFPKVKRIVNGRSCLVIEDSAHTYEHTLAVLQAYGQLVHPGGYMICEDGVMPEVAQALKMFAIVQSEFVADPAREWPVTWNPGGFLRRIVQP